MRKILLAGMAIAMMATPAFAQTYKFVIVPKAMNNPFFDVARDGCLKRAKELGNVECIYKGPVEHEPATQAQIIQDFVTQKVDGLAISVADVAAMTKSSTGLYVRDDVVGDGKVGPTARRLREEYVRFAADGEAVT